MCLALSAPSRQICGTHFFVHLFNFFFFNTDCDPPTSSSSPSVFASRQVIMTPTVFHDRALELDVLWFFTCDLCQRYTTEFSVPWTFPLAREGRDGS